MQLTEKVKIIPTKEQEEVLLILSEKCRLLYNFALAERKEAYENGKQISYRKQQNNLVITKEKYPEYKWVYSKVLQMILRNLHSSYACRKIHDMQLNKRVMDCDCGNCITSTRRKLHATHGVVHLTFFIKFGLIPSVRKQSIRFATYFIYCRCHSITHTFFQVVKIDYNRHPVHN